MARSTSDHSRKRPVVRQEGGNVRREGENSRLQRSYFDVGFVDGAVNRLLPWSLASQIPQLMIRLFQNAQLPKKSDQRS